MSLLEYTFLQMISIRQLLGEYRILQKGVRDTDKGDPLYGDL